jgi:type I restriction enzyme S subunit
VPTAKQGFPVLRLTALRNGRIDLSERKVGAWTAQAAEPYLVAEGDFFVARGNGSIRLVGRGGLLESVADPVAYPDTLIRIRLHEDAVSRRYFGLAWGSSAVRSQIERKAKTTAGIYKINQADIESCQLLLPPLREQLDIAAALESYLSRLDDAVATLERVQRSLKRYRASVLKAAVEGRLVPTEAKLARAEGRDYEPAYVLLDRILAERRRRWEEDHLQRMTAKGQTREDDRWKAEYREPTQPDTAELPSLPEGWCWATVDQVSSEVRYGTSAKTRDCLADGVPVIRMGNLVEGSLDFGNLKYLAATHPEFPDLLLAAGDLLFNRTNSAELVGKTAVFHSYPRPCSYASYLIRVRFGRDIDAAWVADYLNSVFGRHWVASVVSQQVGQANVNGSKLRACAIPLPPAREQTRIVSEVDRLSSLAGVEAEIVDATLHRCERLRQSVLKWAFEGKLVEQDPNDEPATVLLERIRAGRTKSIADLPVKRGKRFRSDR